MTNLLSRIRQSGILLELVNGELKLFASNASVDKALLQEIKERKAELIEFLQNANQAQAAEETVYIPAIGEQENYVLSSSQRRLWILSQLEAGNAAYNMPGVYVFDGDLDVAALTKAFDTLIERHESLRTIFTTNEVGEAVQVIKTAAQTGFHIGQFDLRGANDIAKAVQEQVQQQFATPFDLSKGPLLRAGLIQTADKQWVFTYMMHHIISDGWSMGVLINELLVLYNAYSNGMPNPFPPLRIHYKDYAAWQQEQLSGASLQQHAQYWLKQMEGELPVLDLLGDKNRPPVKTYNGGRTAIMVNPLAAQRLKTLCQEQGGTLFMGLVGAINALLYKYTGQQDIVLGTQIAGRVNEDLENQIGFYLNTLALRTRFTNEDSFKTLLGKVKQVTLGAYQHQVYPFDELVNALPMQRNASRNPLFDVSVVLQNADAGNTTGQEQQSMGNLNVSAYDGQQAISSLFDLAFDFTETADGLQTILVFNSDIYLESSVHNMLVHFEQLMQAAIDQPDLPLNQLTYLSETEKTKLLTDFNRTTTDYPADKTIAELFAEQASKTPAAIAVAVGDTTLSYAQLHEQSEKLALYLQQHCAVGTGDYIGVLLERNALLPVAILGILKAGAAYVPLDTEHPKQRQSFMATDANIKALITQTDYLFEADFFAGTIVALDVQLDAMETPAVPVVATAGPESPAYIMYTSGSTGTPKGVVVPQRAVVRLVKNTNYLPFSGTEILLSTGAVTFDATTFEYWGMWLNGGQLILCSKDVFLDETKLTATIQQHQVNTMWVTAGWFNQLVDKAPQVFDGIKTILTGGERMSVAHVATLQNSYPQLHIVNVYGPTENTTFSTYHPVQEMIENMPIGKPIGNSTAYIYNADMQLQPIGVVGEICVGGDGLALGYLNRPELTAEKFVDNPHLPGEKMYKTGDMGKWLPDGSIAFIGRRDEQVKVRGYRIELGEIEAYLQNHPAVETNLVLPRINKEGEKELVAYIVSQEQLTATAMAAYAAAGLPTYMVPTHFVQLEALPLNANGKVDKQQLPDPEGLGMGTGVEYIAPRNETEEKLVAIWEEILDRSHIGVKDNFFDLGGHSLRATRLAAQMHKTFQVHIELKDLFATPVLEEQASLVEKAQKTAFVAIDPLPEQADYALSSAQRRLWVLSQFEESNIAYNVPGVYVFDGGLNIAALQAAFDTLIERHESLRTVFVQNEAGEVRQVIKSTAESGFHIETVDLRGTEQMEQQLAQLIAASGSRAFDLATGPLIRATLYQVSDANWVFSYCLHHIISDGWSMGILINELFLFYNAHANGQPITIAPLRIQYKDYAAWQQAQLTGETLQNHKAYWLEQFAGELPVLELPSDYVRPPIKTYNGGTIAKVIGAAATTGIKAIGQQKGGTLFMGLVAAVNALLYRYTGQEDIIIGSPIAGREHADLHDQIGFYLNTLALRTRFAGTDSYQTLYDKVQAVTMDAYTHQIYPFDELIDDLNLQRDMSRSALFDVMVVLQNNETKVTTAPTANAATASDTLNAAPYGGGEPPVSKFDITFNFTETGDEIHAVVDYNSDIYSADTIQQMLNHLEQLMQAAVAQPEAPIYGLSYLSHDESTQLLVGFNQTAVSYPQGETLVGWLEEIVKTRPQHTAVVYGDTTITFDVLNQLANQLGGYLRNECAVQPDDRVAICLQRSHWLMVAIVGILKSGGAYIPIDPDYPAERIAFLIKDSACKAVIDDDFIARFQQAQATLDTANLPILVNDHNLAYVIYTSGSTGLPKGVMVEHGNIVNYTHWLIDRYGIHSNDSTVLLAGITFDGVLTGLFGALFSGGAIHIVDKEVLQSPTELADYLKERNISFIKITPSQLKLLVGEADSFETFASAKQLRYIFSGGEAINRADVQKIQQLASHITVVNHYGPTETTVGTISAKVETAMAEIPIGYPISNAQVYLLDIHQQPVPIGVYGEICISGRGLARGYLNNPALTAEKYVTNPFRPGERMYKTGDIGRWQSDGKVLYLGRRDHQVKIRGFRIELGEIEALLQQHPSISATVVLARSGHDGENELAAYIVGTVQLNAQELRNYLKAQLPDYMVPTHFVQLDAFPLNNSGKVDRKALPAPGGLGLQSGVEYIAPRNEVESKLAEIWSELLGRDKDAISVKDNFFELGGHSLKATRLVGRIYKELEVKLPLQSVFIKAILEEQAVLIAEAGKTQYMAIEPLPLQPHYALSPSQRRLWVLSQFEEGNIAYNMPGVYLFEGNINHEALAYAFQTLISRHESLRTVFREDETGEVRQFILPADQTGFAIAYHNLTGTTGQEAQVKTLVQVNASTPFNLAMGSLLRVSLYETDGGKWVFNYVIHHIISDGVSMEILFAEVLQLYSAFVSGTGNPLTPLRIQYKDYAAWQLAQLSGEQLKLHEGYWLQQFSGELPVLDLPGDKTRPAMKTYSGGAVSHFINPEITGGIKKLSQEQGATLFMGLLAATNALLFKYTDQTDIVIGTQIAGREHTDLENQIGFYLNTLALRAQFSTNDSFNDLLGHVKTVTLGAYAHQVYPFDELVNALPLRRDLSRNAIYDVSLILHNTQLDGEQAAPELGGLQISGYDGGAAPTAKFDLAFDFTEAEGGMLANIVYNSDIYNHDTAMRMMAHLQQLLQAIVQQPNLPIAALDYVSEEEKQALLHTFNDTQVAYSSDKTIAELFEQQAAQTPDAIALVFEGTQHTYAQLNEQADRLANYLVTQHQVQAEDCVALLLDRSDNLLIAILGVLKAGAAYVPIDPDYPKGRKLFIVDDTAAKLLITQSNYLLDIDFFNGGIIALDAQLPEMELPSAPLVGRSGPQSLAYIMYTSGSTGNPKGVMVENRSVVRLVKNTNFIQLTGEEVLLSTGAVSFDATTFEYWAMLLNGGTLVMCSKETLLNDDRLVETVRNNKVDTMWFTSGWLNQLVEKNLPVSDGLKTILAGGDKLSPVHISALKGHYPALAIVNGYGPTENTTFSLTYPVQTVSDRIPIGKPINNSTAYIISRNQLVPVGVVGEICVGGDGLARGYLNQPELTAEKFVDNPFVPGQRMYRTGDMGRWLPDGNIEFMGRKDEQVKIRGYRIELGEIENALMQHPAIVNAAVVAKATAEGEKEMVGYIAANETLDATALILHLKQYLPAYMVPAYFVQLETLPLTANGKVDRKQLPDPAGLGMGTGVEYVAPGNDTEEKLVEIWQEILGRETIGIKDNFFDLGGHSLKATQLISKINMVFGVGISIQTVFQEPTIESIAQRIVFIQTQSKQKEDMDDMQEIEI